MIIHYTENTDKLPILTTLNKGKAFPLLTNEVINGVYIMSFDKTFSNGFFDTLERGYDTVEGFRAKVEKVLKMSMTAASKVECVDRLDDFSFSILQLLKEFGLMSDKSK